ncbi:MAG: antibiotic biosynthesis monooxygenase [Alphaproteobacteria bacterium]|nr:antibiotic biosynthesis monooxygenase [Alphaproteobacteria bacterium]
MSQGILAIIKTQPGKGGDFEKAFGDLQAAVRANEKGCLQYDLFRGEEDTYYVFEQYADEEAMKTHGQTEHFKTLGAKMGPFMAGRPDVKRFPKVS